MSNRKTPPSRQGRGGQRRRRLHPMVFAGAAIVAVFGVIAVLVVMQLAKPTPPPREEVRQVTVFHPPPPPPQEEPPPPPPEVEEEIETPEEEPEPMEESLADNEPPPGDLLGLDAEGVGAGDGYGLIGNKGGRGLVGGGGGGNGYLFGELEKAIREQLEDVSELRAVNYEVPARVHFGADGCVERVVLQASTGDAGNDRLLSDSVAGICLEGKTTQQAVASKTVRLRIASR